MKDFIIQYGLALFQAGVLTSVAGAGIRYLRAATKGKNIGMFLSWAEQAVYYVEDNFTGSVKKKEQAIKFIKRRVEANGLEGKFSTEQISGAIEAVVAKLNEGRATEKAEIAVERPSQTVEVPVSYNEGATVPLADVVFPEVGEVESKFVVEDPDYILEEL